MRQAEGGTPVVEAFNSRFRDEGRDQHWFASLAEAQTTSEAWRVEDNTERPHGALGQRTPEAVASDWDQATEAADELCRWTKTRVRTKTGTG